MTSGTAAYPAASPTAPAPNTNPDFTNSRRVRRVRSVAPIRCTSSLQLELRRHEDREPERTVVARVVELLHGPRAEHAVQMTLVGPRCRRYLTQLSEDRGHVVRALQQ